MADLNTDQRQTRSRRLANMLVVLLCSVLLSACIDIEVRSEYRLDGTASHVIQIEIAYVPADSTEHEDIESILTNLEQQITETGMDYERIDAPGLTTVRISGSTGEGQEAGASLNGMLNATGLNATPGVTAPFRGTFGSETGAIGGSAYTLDLVVDGELLFNNIVIDRTGRDDEAHREAVSMTYVATLPGTISDTNGTQIDDDTVRWDVPFDAVTELKATSRTGSTGSAVLFIIVGVAAAIVILGIALVLGRFFAGRQRMPTVLGSGIHRLPGQQTITREGVWVARKISGLTRKLSRSRPDKPADER